LTVLMFHTMHWIALFNLDLDTIRPWLESGGYLLLLGLLFACGLGLPLPEDIPLIASGILIAQHQMHWMFAAPVAWLGIIGGDCMLYHFGKRYGRNITKLPHIGKHITLKRLEKAEQYFDRYGVWVVGIARMFAGIRGAMVVAAGTTRFNFVKFIIADSLAAIVSGGMFMTLGWWFGSNLDLMKHRVHEFKTTLMIVAIVAAIALIAYIWWRTKKNKTPSEAVLDAVIERTVDEPVKTDTTDAVQP
jgi:membrane protein DedA with SNARE-associated domain